MAGVLGSTARDRTLPPHSGSCVQLYVPAACTAGAPATTPEKLKARHNKRIIMPIAGEQCRILGVFMPCTSNTCFQQGWWTRNRSPEPSTCHIHTTCSGNHTLPLQNTVKLHGPGATTGATEPLHSQLKPGMQHWHTLVQQLSRQNGCP